MDFLAYYYWVFSVFLSPTLSSVQQKTPVATVESYGQRWEPVVIQTTSKRIKYTAPPPTPCSAHVFVYAGLFGRLSCVYPDNQCNQSMFGMLSVEPRLEGCSREAMERTARNGHLAVVHLLHDIGATCTSTAVHLAQVHGHHDVFHFLNAMYPGKASKVFVHVPDKFATLTTIIPYCSCIRWYVRIFGVCFPPTCSKYSILYTKGVGSVTTASAECS